MFSYCVVFQLFIYEFMFFSSFKYLYLYMFHFTSFFNVFSINSHRSHNDYVLILTKFYHRTNIPNKELLQLFGDYILPYVASMMLCYYYVVLPSCLLILMGLCCWKTRFVLLLLTLSLLSLLCENLWGIIQVRCKWYYFNNPFISMLISIPIARYLMKIIQLIKYLITQFHAIMK